MVKQIHFHVKAPENHNVYLPNIKNSYVMIFDGKNWALTMEKDIINTLYTDKKDLLYDKFEELVHDLPEHAKRKFNRFINEEQDDIVVNRIKTEIKLLLYNNRKIPIETKEKMCNHSYLKY